MQHAGTELAMHTCRHARWAQCHLPVCPPTQLPLQGAGPGPVASLPASAGQRGRVRGWLWLLNTLLRGASAAEDGVPLKDLSNATLALGPR